MRVAKTTMVRSAGFITGATLATANLSLPKVRLVYDRFVLSLVPGTKQYFNFPVDLDVSDGAGAFLLTFTLLASFSLLWVLSLPNEIVSKK